MKCTLAINEVCSLACESSRKLRVMFGKGFRPNLKDICRFRFLNVYDLALQCRVRVCMCGVWHVRVLYKCKLLMCVLPMHMHRVCTCMCYMICVLCIYMFCVYTCAICVMCFADVNVLFIFTVVVFVHVLSLFMSVGVSMCAGVFFSVP